LGTIELSTGLQVSGNFDGVIEHEGEPVYFQTTGETALAYREKELVGQDNRQHATGFGSPLGMLKGINIAIEDMGPRDLKAYNIYEGQNISLEFEGNISISGEIITGTRNLQGKILLITFRNCTVAHNKKVLFKSNNDLYNMAIGREIVSCFNGPADLASFDLITHKVSSSTSQQTISEERKNLENYYSQIRLFREGINTTISRNKVFTEVQEKFPDDWLLPIELYELAKNNGDEDFAKKIAAHLEEVKLNNPKVGRLIDDGLQLADQSLVN